MQRELGTKRANGCHRKVQLVRGFLESDEKEDENEGGRRSYPNPGRTIRDAGWWTRKGSKRCRGDVRSNGTGSRYSSRWVGCRSIWLNRNGRGNIFKPGKVWCLVVRVGWYRGVGRASHKFTLSYHQMATIPVQALADRAKRSRDFLVLEKRPFLLHTYTHTHTHTYACTQLLFRSTRLELHVESSIMRNNGNRCNSLHVYRYLRLLLLFRIVPSAV